VGISRRQVISGMIASVVGSEFVLADTKAINPKWVCTREVWSCPDPPTEEECKLLCSAEGEASRSEDVAKNSAQRKFNDVCADLSQYTVPEGYILRFRFNCRQVAFRNSNCRLECEKCEDCQVTCRATFRDKCGCEHAALFDGQGKTLRLAKIDALKQVRYYARHWHFRIVCHTFLS